LPSGRPIRLRFSYSGGETPLAWRQERDTLRGIVTQRGPTYRASVTVEASGHAGGTARRSSRQAGSAARAPSWRCPPGGRAAVAWFQLANVALAQGDTLALLRAAAEAAAADSAIGGSTGAGRAARTLQR